MYTISMYPCFMLHHMKAHILPKKKYIYEGTHVLCCAKNYFSMKSVVSILNSNFTILSKQCFLSAMNIYIYKTKYIYFLQVPKLFVCCFMAFTLYVTYPYINTIYFILFVFISVIIACFVNNICFGHGFSYFYVFSALSKMFFYVPDMVDYWSNSKVGQSQSSTATSLSHHRHVIT